MSDRRKKARMMSESERDDSILTLRFLMNGKVKYLWFEFMHFIMILAMKCIVLVSLCGAVANRRVKEFYPIARAL